ncbi:hypothetical protein ACOME3_007281 [Neoechinorhynchus agilis]
MHVRCNEHEFEFIGLNTAQSSFFKIKLPNRFFLYYSCRNVLSASVVVKSMVAAFRSFLTTNNYLSRYHEANSGAEICRVRMTMTDAGIRVRIENQAASGILLRKCQSKIALPTSSVPYQLIVSSKLMFTLLSACDTMSEITLAFDSKNQIRLEIKWHGDVRSTVSIPSLSEVGMFDDNYETLSFSNKELKPFLSFADWLVNEGLYSGKAVILIQRKRGDPIGFRLNESDFEFELVLATATINVDEYTASTKNIQNLQISKSDLDETLVTGHSPVALNPSQLNENASQHIMDVSIGHMDDEELVLCSQAIEIFNLDQNEAAFSQQTQFSQSDILAPDSDCSQ